MAIIDKPNLHFETKLYTGTGSSLAISGLNFQPDLTWVKGRSGATEHVLTDSVRGVTKEISSNDTGAEETVAQGLTAFGSDGFTVGTDGSYNTSSATYASWNFKAGGTASSNSDGSITSSVSANTTSGFSIVSYTGTGLAATVGHGLGVAPKMIIVKMRSGASAWYVYHASNTTAPETDFLQLQGTNATADAATIWNDTAPTATVFSLGTSTGLNASGSTNIAYCFADTSMSKFGSYTGNGSADGPFVYTGFKPAWIMVKGSSFSGENWDIYDNKRETFNVMDSTLKADSSDAESSNALFNVDFTAQGFKLRNGHTGSNQSGSTYIYMAFASEPFVTSTTNGSIPATAR